MPASKWRTKELRSYLSVRAKSVVRWREGYMHLFVQGRISNGGQMLPLVPLLNPASNKEDCGVSTDTGTIVNQSSDAFQSKSSGGHDCSHGHLL